MAFLRPAFFAPAVNRTPEGIDSVEGVEGVLYQVRLERPCLLFCGPATSAALPLILEAWHYPADGMGACPRPLRQALHTPRSAPSSPRVTMPVPHTPLRLQVAETLPAEVLEKMHAAPKDESIPVVDPKTINEVRACRGSAPVAAQCCSIVRLGCMCCVAGGLEPTRSTTGMQLSNQAFPVAKHDVACACLAFLRASQSTQCSPCTSPQADGFAFGFPTRFGMMAAQFKVGW